MNFAGSKYYELSRTLLLSIGLWPYEESGFKQIKMLVSSGCLVSIFFAMIAKIIMSKYDTVIILRTLSIIVPCLIALGKYITFLLLPASLKELMERVQNDWNALKDAKELEIIRKYTHFGSICTIVFLVFGYTCAFGFTVLIYIPNILDIVMPLNVTRERTFPIDVEYFIDQNEYYYAISCHIILSVIFGITTTLGTESLYLVYVHHVCGMFKITCHRLQHAFDQYALRASSTVAKRTAIRMRIIGAIQIHKRALDFYDFLWSKLAVSYFVLITIGVASLSINLFRIFQAIIAMNSANELITSFLFVLAHFIYIFFGNLVGQFFIDHSINVHKNLCNTRWYYVPLREQKLMLFILHRSMNSCKLVAGGTFVLSLEGFTTLIATSISYFTVLSSVQN